LFSTSQHELGAIVTFIQIILLFYIVSSEKMNLNRNTFHKYISVMTKQLAFFPVSANMCISLSKNNSNVRFNYTTCLTIIITKMTMTNRLEEPDSWAVIDSLGLELEIQVEQQSFLLLAAVAE
jgi:hypothetical protein